MAAAGIQQGVRRLDFSISEGFLLAVEHWGTAWLTPEQVGCPLGAIGTGLSQRVGAADGLGCGAGLVLSARRTGGGRYS